MQPEEQLRTSLFVAERRQRNRREIRVALGYGILMALLAIFGKWPLMRFATGGLCVCRAFAALMILRHQGKLESIDEAPGDSYRAKLTRLVDNDTAFLYRMNYYYAVPLGAGLVAIALAFWQNTQSPWITLACLLLALIVITGTYRMNAREVADMNLIRQQLTQSIS